VAYRIFNCNSCLERTQKIFRSMWVPVKRLVLPVSHVKSAARGSGMACSLFPVPWPLFRSGPVLHAPSSVLRVDPLRPAVWVSGRPAVSSSMLTNKSADNELKGSEWLWLTRKTLKADWLAWLLCASERRDLELN